MVDRTTTESAWLRLSADIRQFIRRRVSDEHVAEDLLQETFVRIHKNIAKLQRRDRLRAWVYQITRNVIADHFRRNEKHITICNDLTADPHDGMRHVPANAEAWLEELVQQLSEKYRVAIQLAEVQGLSQQKVADRLGLTLSGAKSRIQRGRAELKLILEKCCTFQFDRRGNLLDCSPLPGRNVCLNCDEELIRAVGG